MSFRVPEKFRNEVGPMGSTVAAGNNGCFMVRIKKNTRLFKTIASDGAGWEHVSVSLPDRTPTWGEMCAIKDIFWGEGDRIVQYHPPKEEYINNHQYCLHLWRMVDGEFPHPPQILIGI